MGRLSPLLHVSYFGGNVVVSKSHPAESQTLPLLALSNGLGCYLFCAPSAPFRSVAASVAELNGRNLSATVCQRKVSSLFAARRSGATATFAKALFEGSERAKGEHAFFFFTNDFLTLHLEKKKVASIFAREKDRRNTWTHESDEEREKRACDTREEMDDEKRELMRFENENIWRLNFRFHVFSGLWRRAQTQPSTQTTFKNYWELMSPLSVRRCLLELLL